MQFLYLKIAKETSCDRAKKSFEPTSPPALVIISEIKNKVSPIFTTSTLCS